MTRTIQCLLLLLTLAILFTSCQPTEPAPPAAAPSTQSEPAATTEPAPAGSDEVAFEPAYPSEVSAEGLSEEDEAQQEAGHSHGDGGHSHDDGGHSHDDDGDGHSHDDGEGHAHDDDDHTHAEDDDHGGQQP